MKKILIVDDDKIFTKILRDAILARHSDYVVLTAKDGEEGLAMAESERPDVMVLDIRMPKLSGIDMLRKLKEKDIRPQIPVLISTQLSATDTISEGIELGVKGYVVKSDYSLESIIEHIHKILSDAPIAV